MIYPDSFFNAINSANESFFYDCLGSLSFKPIIFPIRLTIVDNIITTKEKYIYV